MIIHQILGYNGMNFQKLSLTHIQVFHLQRKTLNSSGWSFNELKDKLIIELGSGAGRFTEILLSSQCYVVSIEMSSAIHANALNNKSNKIIYIKTSLNNLSF